MKSSAIGIILQLAIIPTFFQSSFAQSSFQIHIATSWTDMIQAADNDDYGNTIFVGNSSSFAASEPSYGRIMKVYPDGSFISKNIILTDSVTGFRYMKVLPNGNYFVVAQPIDYLNPQYGQLSIFIFDTSLNIITRKSYSLPEGYTGIGGDCSMVEDNDGNWVLATSVTYYEGPSYFGDFAFYKFNLEGDMLVSKVYETWYDALAYCLQKVPNSNQLMLISQGYLPYTAGELLFLDYNLDIVRVNRIRCPWSSPFDSKIWVSDTSFLMVQDHAEQQVGMPSEFMSWVSVLDTAANYLKTLELNHPDTIEYISQYEGMSYFNDTTIYISSSQSYNNLDFSVPNEAFLYIVDIGLNIRGYKKLGDGNYYMTKGTNATADGGCFVWAKRFNIPYDDNEADIMIWKVMPEDMTLYTHVSYLPPGKLQGHAWPNPVKDELFISLEGFARGETIRYRITDMQGRARIDQKHTVNGNCLHTQTYNLDSGMYIYEVSGPESKIISGKFIKQ